MDMVKEEKVDKQPIVRWGMKFSWERKDERNCENKKKVYEREKMSLLVHKNVQGSLSGFLMFYQALAINDHHGI